MKAIELTLLERLDVQSALSRRIRHYWKFRDTDFFRSVIKQDIRLIRKIGILKAK